MSECQVEQCALFEFVSFRRAGRDACTCRSLDTGHRVVANNLMQVRLHIRQGAHVARLLLHPYQLGVGMLLQRRTHLCSREWMKLFEEDDANGIDLPFFTFDP